MELFRDQVRVINRHQVNTSRTAAQGNRPILDAARIPTTVTQQPRNNMYTRISERKDMPSKQLLKERAIPSPKFMNENSGQTTKMKMEIPILFGSIAANNTESSSVRVGKKLQTPSIHTLREDMSIFGQIKAKNEVKQFDNGESSRYANTAETTQAESQKHK